MKAKIILSCHVPQSILRSLAYYGFEAVLLPDYKRLSSPVASHCDMLVYYDSANGIVTYNDYYLANAALFDSLGVKITTCAPVSSSEYPYDIGLNALKIGDKLFCNGRYTASAVKERFEPSNIINVRQGYSRCSCCVLRDSTVITADTSMRLAFEQNGIGCVWINPGGIMLEPYGYGFIGGATFVCGNRLFAYGDIGLFDGYQQIKAACHRLGIEIISLSDTPLYDYGGGIVI